MCPIEWDDLLIVHHSDSWKEFQEKTLTSKILLHVIGLAEGPEINAVLMLLIKFFKSVPILASGQDDMVISKIDKIPLELYLDEDMSYGAILDRLYLFRDLFQPPVLSSRAFQEVATKLTGYRCLARDFFRKICIDQGKGKLKPLQHYVECTYHTLQERYDNLKGSLNSDTGLSTKFIPFWKSIVFNQADNIIFKEGLVFAMISRSSDAYRRVLKHARELNLLKISRVVPTEDGVIISAPSPWLEKLFDPRSPNVIIPHLRVMSSRLRDAFSIGILRNVLTPWSEFYLDLFGNSFEYWGTRSININTTESTIMIELTIRRTNASSGSGTLFPCSVIVAQHCTCAWALQVISTYQTTEGFVVMVTGSSLCEDEGLKIYSITALRTVVPNPEASSPKEGRIFIFDRIEEMYAPLPTPEEVFRPDPAKASFQTLIQVLSTNADKELLASLQSLIFSTAELSDILRSVPMTEAGARRLLELAKNRSCPHQKQRMRTLLQGDDASLSTLEELPMTPEIALSLCLVKSAPVALHPQHKATQPCMLTTIIPMFHISTPMLILPPVCSGFLDWPSTAKVIGCPSSMEQGTPFPQMWINMPRNFDLFAMLLWLPDYGWFSGVPAYSSGDESSKNQPNLIVIDQAIILMDILKKTPLNINRKTIRDAAAKWLNVIGQLQCSSNYGKWVLWFSCSRHRRISCKKFKRNLALPLLITEERAQAKLKKEAE
ncbi:hypothetical protein Pelo_15136 [Pelomyxa schiedti]|nr:hypothetical protein Pelo_15136 [Pelomyxa schiedti]